MTQIIHGNDGGIVTVEFNSGCISHRVGGEMEIESMEKSKVSDCDVKNDELRTFIL